MTMAQRSELDYLIYNDPLGYADLILNGNPEEYLKNVAGSHGLEDFLNLLDDLPFQHQHQLKIIMAVQRTGAEGTE